MASSFHRLVTIHWASAPTAGDDMVLGATAVLQAPTPPYPPYPPVLHQTIVLGGPLFPVRGTLHGVLIYS